MIGNFMRLNQASDFALRILMFLADKNEPVVVDEIARQLKLVKSHTMKIVAKLVRAKILTSQRGRAGGVTLGKPAEEITVGDVVRAIEADFAIVECMRPEGAACTFLPKCRLKGVMRDAGQAFMDVLDKQSLDSLIGSP